MKAAYFMEHGGPEAMRYGDLPDAVAGRGEVLVDVHAASVNGADWKVRRETYAPIALFPYVPGRDFSGVVAALGTGVRDFAPGDPVFGVCDVGQEGAYAEKIAIKTAIIARKPASLSHAECAALALAGLTALVAIEDTLELKSGETILIHGGAGGVASIAIQLAKHIGAKVITTAGGGEPRLRACARRGRGHRLSHARLHARSNELRRRLRHGRWRGGNAFFRGLTLRRTRRLHRFRHLGSTFAPPGCCLAAAENRARPRPSRTPAGAGHCRRGAPSRNHTLSVITGSGSTRRERRSSPAWQADIDGALTQ